MKVIKNNILVIILILMVLISIAVYGILPTRLPIHFTLTGTVDGTAPKLEGISFMPVMELILWLISSLGIKDINLKKVIDGIGIILFLAQLAIIGVALKPTANINMINAVALSCMIIIIALMTRNNKINRYIGIRTTRTMSNDKIWKKTNTFASNLLLAVGSIGFVLAIFLSNISITIIIALLLIAVASSIVYSHYVK
ncbi:SdpI family protein [Ligilactobacillus salivarius]|uniref:SdpI family protein n=1 Tax=Ligilactobacillus salivarius TaxID=1624 RepID=UPI0020236F92|nr:SdpI family protein [Ligilactobacillus salivarius]URI12802.1 SdpI family protein [Ligilactobacillus salivarius]UUB34629.1 SdpI family protein [Ligilactobacillus salivarius]